MLVQIDKNTNKIIRKTSNFIYRVVNVPPKTVIYEEYI